jgi:general secretion pathway protein D
MRTKKQPRIFFSFLLTFCLLAVPLTALAKKGEKNFRKGMEYEAAQQWEKAAQEFTLALAANPSDVEYQLHFRRASFNASQAFMQQGRSLAEKQDYVGAFNAFRQAYGYDPVNSLAVSEMERMLRLQNVKDGNFSANNGNGNGTKGADLPDGGTLSGASSQTPESVIPSTSTQQLRVVTFSGDLKQFIRSLAEQLNLNVVFDRQSFAQPRQIDLNLRDVTTAQALDYVFLQEGLFFQKLSRRTILVADQTRRPQYQQLVLRTFFLSNIDPTEARTLVTQAIPPSVGRPQTIVVPDKATNSLTVRDTAENVRLIGELLQSIDKDRAEVVMDVNIYEVSTNDLLKLGNQIGTGDGIFSLGGSPGMAVLSQNGAVNNSQYGVNLSSIIGSLPTGGAYALLVPPMAFTAFQSKDNTKLIASTQVHAFNGEESTARIGQRVPVQTAQAYPFGVQTGTSTTPGGFPSGGFPVINYEPTGLTLKFTPQVFPNLDVQVKMSIESKDVLNASSLTPTFTERTITGTARVQNNRTMMLASVATDTQTQGRRGLPLVGLIPVLGRLFTAPTRDNRRIDIVIAVTPRVLRAPAVTPRDEEMRPSGTLQSPTTGSLEAMIRDSDRDDQLAAARRLPKNPFVEVRTADPGTFGARGGETAQAVSSATNGAQATNTVGETAAPSTSTATAPARVPASAQAATQKNQTSEELPSYVPAPKSLVSEKGATELAAVNPGAGANAVLTSLPSPIETSAAGGRVRTASLSLSPADHILTVGEKRKIAVELNSEAPLGLAVLTLRFDPKVMKINSVTPGSIFAAGKEKGPSFTQSVDPSGVCMVSVSTLNGIAPMSGKGVLVFIEIEAVAAGDAVLLFDQSTMHLVATDARDVTLEVKQGRTIVKQ